MDKDKFAVTPPMGWNSYDYYDTTVTEADVRANAEYMAAHLKQYGWEYVVIDIEWYSNKAGTKRDAYQYIPFEDFEMDEYSRLLPSPERFPSSRGGKGFGPLAADIHKMGLKFGIHIMRGIPRNAAHRHLKVLGTDALASDIADPSSICGWNPDMYGVRHNADGQAYYDSLLSLYAGWGVDFIKCDDICDSWMYPAQKFSGWEETRMLRRAIDRCGRDIVLSLSPGPAHIEMASHYMENANMWRITDDFWDDWKLLKNMFWRCGQWQGHVREGCWPDCDMLPIGKLGKGHGREWTSNFNEEELKTMMTLWCIARSPLMIGADLPQLEEKELALLTNDGVLEMLRDGKGVQLRQNDNEAVWVSEGSRHVRVALFNLSEEERTVSVSFSREGDEASCLAVELWGGEGADVSGGRLSARVPAHGVRCYQLEGKSFHFAADEPDDPAREEKALAWEEVETQHLEQNEWIDFRRSSYRFPDGKVFAPFYSYTRRDYVVVVASDTEGKYLCVRQFRQGIRKVTTEFPAGGIERKDADGSGPDGICVERALAAAKRELLEETGYESDEWEHLLKVPSQATISDNYAYLFAARNCRKVSGQSLDETEFLRGKRYEAQEIEEMIANGAFQQAVHVTAWLLARRRP